MLFDCLSALSDIFARRDFILSLSVHSSEPVGILPTPSRSRCGKKGQDSGRDGDNVLHGATQFHPYQIGIGIHTEIAAVENSLHFLRQLSV